VRTVSFKLLYGLVILRHTRRRLVSIGVTSNPTAEWIAGQVTDAFPWDEAPRHLIRDRDGAFGSAYTRLDSCNGDPRSPYRTALAVAERPRRAADRIDTSRISRPPRRVRRSALARCPEGLRFLLQQSPAASVTGQRMLRIFAGGRRSAASHRFQSSAAPSSIRPTLVLSRHNPSCR
jgi:hypothetical protein